jgi:hypothetical protein
MQFHVDSTSHLYIHYIANDLCACKYFKTHNTLENKLKEFEDLLKKFSSDNLKSMLCIHTDNFNKLGIIIDDLGSSASYASDSELNSLFIKPLIVDTICLDKCDNSCLKNYVEPKFNYYQEKQTRGKFVPTCHHCGIIGHIRPNCYLLKS